MYIFKVQNLREPISTRYYGSQNVTVLNTAYKNAILTLILIIYVNAYFTEIAFL